MIIFGTIGIFVKHIPLPSSLIAFVRGVIGSLLLLLIVMLSKSKLSVKAVKKNLLLLICSGAAIGFNWILLFEAYKHTTVATATLCYYLAPVIVTILSPFVLKEKLTIFKTLCVMTALVGMIFVSGIHQINTSETLNLTGILFGVGAAALYSSVILMNKFLKNISSFDSTLFQLGVASVVLLPYTLITENFSEYSVSPTSIVLLVVLGVLHTGIAYYLYFSSLQYLKGQTIAIFSYIDPVVAILLSAVLLGESMGIYEVIGAVLILGSTMVSNFDSSS